MSTVGGGSAPGAGLPTRLLAISRDGLTADALEASLRRLDPPVIARIERDRVVFDLRTVEPADDQRIETLLTRQSEFGAQFGEFGMRTNSDAE